MRGIIVHDAFCVGSASGLEPDDGHHAGGVLVRCGIEDGSVADILPRHWHAASLQPLSLLTHDGNAEFILHRHHHKDQGPPPHDERCAEHADASSAAVQQRAKDISTAAAARQGGVRATPAPVDGEEPLEERDASREAGLNPSGAGRSQTRPVLSGTTYGMDFLVVCLCFFSDDVRARRGKEISLGGVYTSYLLWLFRPRRSSHAVPTLAATPPDVDSDVVLESITPDVRVGSTHGWLMVGADGSSVRVFADVCFYVGDYLQVAKTSTLMGHGANSSCTMCSYRLSGAPRCRYGLDGASNLANLVRTTARTRSVCKAVSERAALAKED